MSPRRAAPAATRANANANANAHAHAHANANADQATNDRKGPKAVILILWLHLPAADTRCMPGGLQRDNHHTAATAAITPATQTQAGTLATGATGSAEGTTGSAAAGAG